MQPRYPLSPGSRAADRCTRLCVFAVRRQPAWGARRCWGVGVLVRPGRVGIRGTGLGEMQPARRGATGIVDWQRGGARLARCSCRHRVRGPLHKRRQARVPKPRGAAQKQTSHGERRRALSGRAEAALAPRLPDGHQWLQREGERDRRDGGGVRRLPWPAQEGCGSAALARLPAVAGA